MPVRVWPTRSRLVDQVGLGQGGIILNGLQAQGAPLRAPSFSHLQDRRIPLHAGHAA